MLPLFIRLVRAEMMEVLETEYIKFAWAKGLHRKRVWFIHAFKNTLLPVITVFGVQEQRRPAALPSGRPEGRHVRGAHQAPGAIRRAVATGPPARDHEGRVAAVGRRVPAGAATSP